MKYYLIVGEASGDLHASNLMKSLKKYDSDAEFRYFGGDLMKAVGGTCVKHYRDLAYMGIIPVLLHFRTILRNMKVCQQDVLSWKPDVLILVDYPGFNLDIAKYVKKHTKIPVYYYISPKIWAWKEYRIKNIKRDVDELFSILPFEVIFFKKHKYPIHYIGNPSVDSVVTFQNSYKESFGAFTSKNELDNKPIIAILAGSRKQEIHDNLPKMLEAVSAQEDYQPVIAGAPSITPDYYADYLKKGVHIVYGQTYELLSHSTAALVTSGTATLETALFKVPQVVCYDMPLSWLMAILRKLILKVKYISLVNLISDKDVVKELVVNDMKVANIKKELASILPGGDRRQTMLNDYQQIIQILGAPGASERAAEKIIECLKDR